MSKLGLGILGLFATLICSVLTAQDIKVETVIEGLNNPCSVAIQPDTGHVFVADSGALRIVRIVDGKATDVITDFPKDVYGNGPKYDIGPLGLCFLDKETLVVGGGGKPDGEELLRVFQVPAVGKEAIKADKTHGKALSIPASGETVGEGNFYGLARGNLGVFVTCNGDDEKGWVSLAGISEEKKLTEFSRSIATKELTKVDAPVGITLSPDGYVVVGQMGEINVAEDSLLTFYSEEGKLLENYKTGLNDISGLAYGPNHGRLFAIDFNWQDTDNGGLYKLVGEGEDRKQGCSAELITQLKKPTSMAFAANGDLFITLAGNMSEGSEQPDGKLVVIKNLDVDSAKEEK